MEKEAILDLGFEMCKIHRAPHIFLWLADEGWERGVEIAATQHDPHHAMVQMAGWKSMILPTPSNLN